MKAAPYDMFRKDLLGTPVWMEAVQDLETANFRVMEFSGPLARWIFCFFPGKQRNRNQYCTALVSVSNLASSSIESKTWSHFICFKSIPVLLGQPTYALTNGFACGAFWGYQKDVAPFAPRRGGFSSPSKQFPSD